MSKLPTIIKTILIEAYLDFKDIEMGDDVSQINLINLLTEVNEGKDELNIIEGSVLFEFFYKGYEEFIKSHRLDEERLLSDPFNYYDELHQQYYDDIDFQSLDRSNPTTLMILKNSIHCENFILIHYIKSNFNIIYYGPIEADSYHPK